MSCEPPVSSSRGDAQLISFRNLLRRSIFQVHLSGPPPVLLSPAPSRFTELVINWHFTEACNYKCEFCYAKWDSTESLRSREIFHDEAKSRRLLDELHSLFQPGNPANLLTRSMHWDEVRLSIAGGEPLLYPEHVLRIIEHAYSLGFRLSIITNGSKLKPTLIDTLMPRLSMLGLSIDSMNRDTAQAIGRVDPRGSVLSVDELLLIATRARERNPNLLLKVNTVVNALNWQEDLRPLMRSMAPEKWKLLRALGSVSNALTVSPEQFQHFVEKNHLPFVSVEDNTDMQESYLMVDPHGRFFQNQVQATGYTYSPSIVDVGAAEAFKTIRFRPERFLGRYDNGLAARTSTRSQDRGLVYT